MIKKLIFGLSFFIFASLQVHAQNIENALLWKVTGNGIEKASYLYGTIHITCEIKTSDVVKKAFESTEQLGLEIDMSDPSLQMQMMKSMYMKNGKSIADYTTEEEIQRLQKLMDGKVPGMNFEMMQHIKPFFLSAMAMSSFANCDGMPLAYDTYFMQKALQAKKEIFGLEKLQDQFDMIDKVSYEHQVQDLLKMADLSEEDNIKKYQELISLYESKDLKGMMDYMVEDDSSVNLYQEDFLDKRNQNWISIIEEKANSKSTFFAFGAAHLAGENGVVNLLRKQGYKVEPMDQ